MNEICKEKKRIILGNRLSSFYIMINRIRELEILPTENFLRLLNMVSTYTGTNNQIPQIECSFGDDSEDVNFKLETSLVYNRCKCGFKKKDYFITETLIYEAGENVILNCKKCMTIVENTKFNIKILFGNEIIELDSEIFSIRKILHISKNMYQDYLKYIDLNKLNLNLLKKLILNLLFYTDKENFLVVRGFLLRSFMKIHKRNTI